MLRACVTPGVQPRRSIHYFGNRAGLARAIIDEHLRSTTLRISRSMLLLHPASTFLLAGKRTLNMPAPTQFVPAVYR